MSDAPDIPQRVRRARSFHRPWRLWWVSLLHFLSWLSMAGFIGMVIAMVGTGERRYGVFSLILLFLFLVTRGLAFLFSRHLFCPLCMGRVMASVRCLKHAKAQRIRPLSYRATAVLAVIFTLGFRCMYCGTRFRLRR